jgi:cell division protein FtsL
MQTDHHEVSHTHHRNRHMFQKMEGAVGVAMVIAIAVLAIGLVYGLMTGGGDPTPVYLR